MKKIAPFLLSALLTFSLVPVCLAAEELFKQVDANQDAVISIAEFLEFYREADFKPKRDVNNAGLLFADESNSQSVFQEFRSQQ